MPATADDTRLTLEGISVAYRGVPALEEVSLALARREILGVIGPNGAGKTTLINVVSGYAKPDAGSVRLGTVDVTGRSPERIARSGVGRTFQGVRLFARLSVRENVEVAALAAGQGARTARDDATALLEQFELTARADDDAASLPYGDERRLSLARSLAARPAFLLLDEPAAGLDELETRRLAATIATLPDRYGCGVLIVEHDVGLILGLSHRVQVLAHGKTIATGSPDAVRSDPVVIESYLGRRGAQHARG